MLQRIVFALNSINTPILAIVVIVIGCFYSVICQVYGMDGKTAASIIGGGLGLLTGAGISALKQHAQADPQAADPPAPQDK